MAVPTSSRRVIQRSRRPPPRACEPGDRVVTVNGRHAGVNGIRIGDRERQGRAGRRSSSSATGAGWRCAPQPQQGDRRRLPARLRVRHRPTGRYSAVHAPTSQRRRCGRSRRARCGALGDVVTPSGRSQLHSSVVGIVASSRPQAEQAGATDYLEHAGVHLALARDLQPAAVPAPGRRARADIALERVRGKMVSRAVFERVSVLGIMLMALLFVFGLQKDVGRAS